LKLFLVPLLARRRRDSFRLSKELSLGPCERLTPLLRTLLTLYSRKEADVLLGVRAQYSLDEGAHLRMRDGALENLLEELGLLPS
jgi:hypothetical protein